MDGGLEERLVNCDEEEEEEEVLLIECKKLWRVAAPCILTRLSMFGMFVVTQVFMGHIGSTQLASYALVQTVFMRFANGILLGMGSALETFCGQAFGAKQYSMMGIYMQRSWIVLLITATLLLPLYIFTTPMLKFLGQSEELSEAAGPIALWFIPITYNFAFNFTLQMFLQSQMKNAIIGWLAIASFALHIALSWVMVDKLGLGVGGAMGSMVITSWLTIFGEFAYVFGGWTGETWPGFSSTAFQQLWPVAKLSLSSGVMTCAIFTMGEASSRSPQMSAMSVANIECRRSTFIQGRCGTHPGLNITSWELMIALGFLTAASVRVANELGRGNAKATIFAVKVVVGTSICIGLLFFVFFMSIGNILSYAFTDSASVAKAVGRLKVLLSLSVLLNSLQPVLSGVAIGAGWQSIVAYVNIGCYYVIGIPLGVVLGYVAHLGINGIWSGMICGVALQTIVLSIITAKTDWDMQVRKAWLRINRWSLPAQNKTEERSDT